MCLVSQLLPAPPCGSLSKTGLPICHRCFVNAQVPAPAADTHKYRPMPILADYVSDDDDEDVVLGDYDDKADDDGDDDDGEEGDDGEDGDDSDDDDEDSVDEAEIEHYCRSMENVIEAENKDDGDADEDDGKDSVVEYVPDGVELLAPVVAVPAPKHANPEPLAPNPRPFAKRKCWTFGQKVSAIQKMERLSLTLCQAEKDLCIPFSNLQNWKKKQGENI